MESQSVGKLFRFSNYSSISKWARQVCDFGMAKISLDNRLTLSVCRAPQNLTGKLAGYLTVLADHFAVDDRIVHADGTLDQSSGLSGIIVRPFRLTRVNRIRIKNCKIGGET